MLNFTHNNHLKYYIGDRLYDYRRNPFEPYRLDIGAVDLDHYLKSNWLHEQYKISELITQELGSKFSLFYSGGTDSEIVLRLLLKIGKPPDLFFIRFKNGLNHQDYTIATQVSESLGIKLNVIDVDIIDFFKSGEAWDLASEMQCSQIAYLNVYNQIKKIGMPTIMGGEPLLKRKPGKNGSTWHFWYRENEDGIAMRFSLKYNIPLIYEWFTYTPEAIGYFVEHPIMKNLVSDYHNYKLSSVSSKNIFLKQMMPDISGAPKLHGFEKLMQFNRETYFKLSHAFPKRMDNSVDGIPIDQFRIKLFGEDYARG